MFYGQWKSYYEIKWGRKTLLREHSISWKKVKDKLF
jgi:hypothetical protein